MPKRAPHEVQAFLAKLPAQQRKTVIALKSAILKANPTLSQTLNPWGYLTFSTSKVKYAFVLVPHSKHVNFQIFNGAKLSKDLPQLEGTGKGLRHIKFPYGKAVDTALVAKAVRLSLAAQ